MRLPSWLTPLNVATAGAILFFAMDFAVRFGSEARRVDGAPADRGTTRGMYLAFLAILLAGFGLPRVLPPRFANVPATLAWIGAALVPPGLLIRLWATLTLRHAYSRSLRIQPGQELMRRGPYRWVRHPGYLGSLTTWSGIGFASANALSIAITLAALAIAYGRRIRHEEAMLLEAFGERYREYRREVAALIPFLRGGSKRA